MKKLKSYRFDDSTIELIDELKGTLHVENNSAVIRKAVKLLKIISENQESGGHLILVNSKQKREIIIC